MMGKEYIRSRCFRKKNEVTSSAAKRRTAVNGVASGTLRLQAKEDVFKRNQTSCVT